MVREAASVDSFQQKGVRLMKRTIWPALTATAVLLIALTPRGQAEDKPARLTLRQQEINESLGTDWYGVYMLGQKVGYARGTLARATDAKKPGYIASIRLHMTIVAAGAKQELEMAETFEFEAEPPYPLRRGIATETGRNAARKTELVRTAKGFEAIRTADGTTTRQAVGALDYTFTDEVMPRVWIQRGPKVGERLNGRTFDFEKLRLDSDVRKLLSTKTSVVEGVKVTYHEVENTSAKVNVPLLERYNENGRLLSGKLGSVIELRYESEREAKNIEHSADLFLLGSVKIDKPLGDAARVTSLVLTIDGKERGIIKSGPRQSVEFDESNTSAACRIGRKYDKAVKATKQEQEENVAETTHYPITNAKIKALVKDALKDAETPKEKVETLVHFVARYMTPDFQVRPRSVLQIIEVKKGACTEYAHLFATLARAAGIPAREVGGLVYMGDDQKAFGPHAWNEVILDGQWVPVDCSWNETEINATHVRFGASEADDLNWLTGFLSTFGKLSFRVEEVQYRD
jgi:transglutaminase-like putative cysteine protease